jgi:hypothetical protein
MNFEAGAASKGEKTKIIPGCFGGLTKAKLPAPYSSSQAIEIRFASDCYDLADAIASHLGKKRPEWPGRFSDKENELAKRPYRRLAWRITGQPPHAG